MTLDLEALKRGLNDLRAHASRGPVSSREIFTLTDPLMDMIARSEAAPSGQADILQVLEAGQPFGFDPATGFLHADDGGAPASCVFYEPKGQAPLEGVHSDDLAVDKFAEAMKAKLKWEREVRERGGWDDPAKCSVEYLARLLIEHLGKGNAGTFEDVANFAMMLHQRRADPKVLAAALLPASAEPVDENGRVLAHRLADIARSLLNRPPELRGPFRTDEEALRRVAALPPKTRLASRPPAER